MQVQWDVRARPQGSLSARGPLCDWSSPRLTEIFMSDLVADKKCPSCASLIGGNFKFCPHCGSDLIYLTCPHCAQKNNSAWKFCQECGQALQQYSSPGRSGRSAQTQGVPMEVEPPPNVGITIEFPF